jgi:dTDP-4-dehydrorhamnose 3,5-epimerase
LPEVVIVEPVLFEDERGWFMESYNERKFHRALAELGLPLPRAFVQDNHSRSGSGVLRGLHFQVDPHAQGKLVRVVKGAVWDVTVDVRASSPMRGQWFGLELSAANRRQLWIPEGFAHGFLTLEEDTHFLYKTTDYYARECERSFRWNDPTFAIEWPLERIAGPPLLAPKDATAPFFVTPGS